MANDSEKLLLVLEEDGQAQVTGFAVTTTAPNQTLSFTNLVTSEETTIDWGDGSSNAYTGVNAPSHQYASAGTYSVTFDLPENVTLLDIRDSKATVNSADVKNMVNMDNFTLSAVSGTFNSVDIADWRPSLFRIFNVSGVFGGTFDSADVANWNPETFYLISISGFGGTFDSADVANWNPIDYRFYSMPVAYDFTISNDSDFDGWTATTTFRMDGNALTQAQVDTILYSLYSMTTSRTASNGTINLGGSNAAPSGTFQAAASCPVDTDTPGKEVAHELLNDTCAVGFNTWATVTITA